MQKYAMIGGILSIISGAFGILAVIFIVLFMLFFTMIPFIDGESMPIEIATIIIIIYSIIAFFMLLVSALAIVGGAFSIKKKIWPLALAGAIAGSYTCYLCGIPAIIFTTMAKPEFDEAKIQASIEQQDSTE